MAAGSSGAQGSSARIMPLPEQRIKQTDIRTSGEGKRRERRFNLSRETVRTVLDFCEQTPVQGESFIRTSPPTISAAAKILGALADSPSSRQPTTKEPMAPMPVQTG